MPVSCVGDYEIIYHLIYCLVATEWGSNHHMVINWYCWSLKNQPLHNHIDHHLALRTLFCDWQIF